MGSVVAIYDACVLYSAPLRDLLMQIALADLIQAKWTEAIHDEWTQSLLRSRPDLKPEQLQRTRDLMNAHVRDCLVSGYESLIPSLQLPDPGDHHVLAAAITCRATTIVTFNTADFPASALVTHGIVAEHPDHFLLQLLQQYPDDFCAAVRRQRSSLKNPPKTAEELLAILAQQRLTLTVSALQSHLDDI